MIGLVVHNLLARKVRTALTALAVAVGVATVATLGVVTHSLRRTATSVLEFGEGDFTVAQRDVGDVLASVITDDQVERIAAVRGVKSAVGGLGVAVKLDDQHPIFLEVGAPSSGLDDFGVRIIDGRAFDEKEFNEIILGALAADELDKKIGDEITLRRVTYTIVGIYRTGQPYVDAAAMTSLVKLQASERKSGLVTLAFVKAKPSAHIQELRARIEHKFPQLVTIESTSEAGLVDRNLKLISAADTAASIVALLIGAVIVMNVMMLSFFERIREFGIVRAVGWSRRRVISLVMGEALVIGVVGTAVGIGLALVASRILEGLPDLVGLLDPQYSAGVFGRALATAVGMVIIGGIYPAIRAARLAPLEALRRE